MATKDGHDDKVYALAGDAAFTLAELPGEISRQTGREIPIAILPRPTMPSRWPEPACPKISRALAGWETGRRAARCSTTGPGVGADRTPDDAAVGDGARNPEGGAAKAAKWSTAAVNVQRRRWPGFGEAWEAALRPGYTDVEMLLIENARATLGDAEVTPVPSELASLSDTMSVGDALNLLRIHRAAVEGEGCNATGCTSRSRTSTW